MIYKMVWPRCGGHTSSSFLVELVTESLRKPEQKYDLWDIEDD